jgi:hypothetical protein
MNDDDQEVKRGHGDARCIVVACDRYDEASGLAQLQAGGRGYPDKHWPFYHSRPAAPAVPLTPEELAESFSTGH